MRFDINAFFGHWPYWPLPQTSGDGLRQLMDRWRIDRAAVTSLRGLHGDWRAANAETLALAEAHPDRFVPVACISPLNGGGADALGDLAGQGFRAVRIYPLLLQGYGLRSEFAAEVARAAGELGLAMIVATRPMMNFRFPTLPIDDVAGLAQLHPATTFILSGPNYLSEFLAAIEALRRCPNLVIETSCMQGLQALARMVEAVGADRVLFGTGAVLHYPACNVAKLEHARLAGEPLADVAGRNAIRILRISEK